MKETNLEEKIKIAEERINQLNILITQWRKQNEKNFKSKTPNKIK